MKYLLLLTLLIFSCSKEDISTPSIIADCEALKWLPNGTGHDTDAVDNVWRANDNTVEYVLLDDCSVKRTDLVTGEVCYGNMPSTDCYNFGLFVCGENDPIQIRSVTEFELVVYFVKEEKEVVFVRVFI